MSWRIWQFKPNSTSAPSSTAVDTRFATVISPSASLSARIQRRVAEERRGLMQMLAILQSVLALLMPMVMHFLGLQATWLMLLPILLALVFMVCAWLLMDVNPFISSLMVAINVFVVPLALFAWLVGAGFSALSLVLPFVIQMMLLLVLSLKPRMFVYALSFCIALALLCVWMSPNTTLERAGAILLLSIAVTVLLLIAQTISNQHVRLGAIRQHVRKDSEKMAVRAEKMRRLALSDGLTGLANRLSLMNKLQRLVTEPERARHAVVYLIDLDFFKTVNDQYGHAAGDAVLIECGQRFQSVVRRGDVVCRLGGDEFVIVVQGLTGFAQAQVVAKKILQKLAEPLMFEGAVMPLGGSIGIALWHPAITSAEIWLGEADAAMYQAKSAGRNQFYVSRIDV